MASGSSSSQEWLKLLQDTLGNEEGAAVAASLTSREVIINVTGSEDRTSGRGSKKTDQGIYKPGEPGTGHGDVETGDPARVEHDKSEHEVVDTEEPGSVLHVVAAAGDSRRHLQCASKIHEKASHLLTMAAPSSKGDTPLHCAARVGNTNMVAHLIKLAAERQNTARDLVRTQNKRGETALHEAVRFGGVKMVEALMSGDKGLASVNAKNGTSPMYLASTLGRVGVAVRLHDCGDEPSYSGPRGQNALHAAVLHDYRVLTKLLLGWNKRLVEQRGGMNLVRETDVDGSTPLHFAAAAPDPTVQSTLFVFSASNFERSCLGSFFMYLLPSRWLTQVFDGLKLPFAQLLEADPTAAFQPDRHGSFPVHVAASADSMVSLIALLTRYPACAALRNAKGQTFLHVAVQEKRIHAVAFVCHLWGRRPISKSVVNVQDSNGDTALHLAVRQGELDMCRYLIGNRHTRINLENNEGETSMDLAARGVKCGFYFGMMAQRRILSMLTSAGAQTGSRRHDLVLSKNEPLETEKESEKIKDFAQIVGIGSVLVATATFTAALTMPGGVWTPGDSTSKKLAAPPPAGTPVLAGSFAFDGFVISNTVAFICSTLATFSLVYCGVATVDIQKRFELVTFSLALLLCSARSFCAALAFALYLLLAKVAYGTAIASIVMTSLALIDGLWFLVASLNDTASLVMRRPKFALMEFAVRLQANIIYLFWPYLLVGGYLLYDTLKMTGNLPRLGHH